MFKDLTKVEVPADIDVILVAPKGSGRTVRTLFKNGLFVCLLRAGDEVTDVSD